MELTVLEKQKIVSYSNEIQIMYNLIKPDGNTIVIEYPQSFRNTEKKPPKAYGFPELDMVLAAQIKQYLGINYFGNSYSGHVLPYPFHYLNIADKNQPTIYEAKNPEPMNSDNHFRLQYYYPKLNLNKLGLGSFERISLQVKKLRELDFSDSFYSLAARKIEEHSGDLDINNSFEINGFFTLNKEGGYLRTVIPIWYAYLSFGNSTYPSIIIDSWQPHKDIDQPLRRTGAHNLEFINMLNTFKG